MDLFTLASSIGLSAPLTLLAIGLLHALGVAPAFIEVAVQRHPALVSPAALGAAALLFLFEVLASKSKLTKPFKAMWDLAQLVVKPLATGVLGVALVGGTGAPQAAAALVTGVPGAVQASLSPDLSGVLAHGWGWFELSLAVAVTLLVHLVRAGADVIVWFSPFPLIDAAVSTIADAHAAFMIAVAVFFPRLAAVLCALQLLVCLLLAGRMARVLAATARMVSGLWRAASQTRRAPPAAVAARPGGTGAVWCWAVRGGAAGRWSRSWAWVAGGALHVAARRRWRWRFIAHPLGGDRHAALAGGLVARDLKLQQGARAIAVLRFPRDREDEVRSLAGALAAEGVPLDALRAPQAKIAALKGA